MRCDKKFSLNSIMEYFKKIVIILLLIIGFYTIYHLGQIISPYEVEFKSGFISDPKLFNEPHIVRNFISEEDCQKIVSHSEDKLFDSEIVGGSHKNIRNSMQCWISKDDPIVKKIFDKACLKFNVEPDTAESLQVVRYFPNQYYNEHHDSCCESDDSCKEFVKRGGQRKLTVLIYLNNKFSGGETNFPNLRKKFKPNPGDALIFYPLDKNLSKCHELSLHAGLPVKSGEKWIANLWFREGKFE